MNTTIPLTVVDDFFENPKWVAEYASSLVYEPDQSYAWPGTRSLNLAIINPNMFNFIINKALALYYYTGEAQLPPQYNFHWAGHGNFHRVAKDQGTGWVHKDTAIMTGIIFLNEQYNPNAGTSIYDIKTGLECDADSVQHKRDFFAGKISKDEVDPWVIKNNNLFEETITVKNKFNRLMLFDSNSWHGANDYSDKENLQNGDRLTFTFFIEQFTAKKSPVYRMRNYS